MEIDKQKKKETFFEITDSLTSLELVEYIEDFKERYGIKEAAFISTTQKTEEKKTTSSANVSLKVLEVGKQPILLYGIVKDIINEVTGGQINAVNAMNIIKQKKPIVENISQEKAEAYIKRLEGETEEEKAKKGVVIEIIK
jgi:hypothetical protein